MRRSYITLKQERDLVTTVTVTTSRPSLVRRQLGGLIPPKIATPGILVRPFLCIAMSRTLNFPHEWQSGGSGSDLTSLVSFYSKLPKGPAPSAYGGIKTRFFSGKNASPLPLYLTVLSLFGLGYTIDYQSKFHHLCHPLPTRVDGISLSSAFEYISPFLG